MQESYDMKRMHEIVDCAFPRLDIGGYVDQFMADRRADQVRLGIGSWAGLGSVAQEAQAMAAAVCETCCEGQRPKSAEGDIVTRAFLSETLQDLARCGNMRSERRRVVNALQKKFEVFHRLFDVYDTDLRKKGDAYQTVDNYVMLSVLLNLLYQESGSLNSLNTSIKLNDLVLRIGWRITGECRKLLAFALGFEQLAVERCRAI